MIAGIVLLVVALLIEPAWKYAVNRMQERASADTSWGDKGERV